MRLYMVAILPPENISKKIRLLKEEASKDYDSYKALNSPPHITLIPPFAFEDEQLLIDSIQSFEFHLKNNMIKLLNFNHFGTRTIFISVEKNARLTQFRQHIKEQLYDKLGIHHPVNNIHTFVPHITILNRDITIENYQKAWTKFKKTSFQDQFEFQSISLLKNSDGWKELIRKSF